MKRINEKFTLANGVLIPKIGFGTWMLEEEKQCMKSVTYALESGYTHIDTATEYENEEFVGKAIRDFAVRREDMFITTKLPGDIKSVEEAKACFEESLEKLQVDYIDMYLIHSPIPWDEYDNPGANYDKENVAIWQLMEKWYDEDLVRAIGVSNFPTKSLAAIMSSCKVVPHVNQVCYYVGCTQPTVAEYCRKNKIQLIGHSPFAHGELIKNKEVVGIAQKYNKSVPQLCIAFALQNGVIPLPKSTHKKYILANTDVDFMIAEEDMRFLSALTDTIPDVEEDYLE